MHIRDIVSFRIAIVSTVNIYINDEGIDVLSKCPSENILNPLNRL